MTDIKNHSVICPLKTTFNMQFINILGGITLSNYFNIPLYTCRHFYFIHNKDNTGNYIFTTYWDKVLEIKNNTWVEYNNTYIDNEVLKLLYTDTSLKRRRLFTKSFVIPGYIVVNPRSFNKDFTDKPMSNIDLLKYNSLSMLKKNCKLLISYKSNLENYTGIYFTFNHRNQDLQLLQKIKELRNDKIYLVTDNIDRAKIDLYPMFDSSCNVTIHEDNIFETFEHDISDEENLKYQKKIMQLACDLATCKIFYPYYSDQYSCIFIQYIRNTYNNPIDIGYTRYGPVEIFLSSIPDVPIGSDF